MRKMRPILRHNAFIPNDRETLLLLIEWHIIEIFQFTALDPNGADKKLKYEDLAQDL